MAAENGFKINGEIYEVPTLDSLDLDERYILYDYTTLAAEDFAAEEGESEDETIARVTPLFKHPGWWPALQHIAYRRKHKDEMSDTRMKKLILAANSDLGASAEILSTLGEPPKDGEGEDPPSTSELDESSPPNSDGSSESLAAIRQPVRKDRSSSSRLLRRPVANSLCCPPSEFGQLKPIDLLDGLDIFEARFGAPDG